uniref:Uncharacterized protein n=1 Tax=Molossus molossus TaxID=27622 RepID=A0A7J8E2L2_MOLMO|nr:hypothetical protein HJG59_009005 [Molossus molossus]
MEGGKEPGDKGRRGVRKESMLRTAVNQGKATEICTCSKKEFQQDCGWHGSWGELDHVHIRKQEKLSQPVKDISLRCSGDTTVYSGRTFSTTTRDCPQVGWLGNYGEWIQKINCSDSFAFGDFGQSNE